jgi:hypothetical protein
MESDLETDLQVPDKDTWICQSDKAQETTMCMGSEEELHEGRVQGGLRLSL